MYANDPLILVVLLADRRADLQRAATPSRTTPISHRPSRLRRLIGAMTQRKRPSPQPAALDRTVESEAAAAARPEPMPVGLTCVTDEETRELACVAG